MIMQLLRGLFGKKEEPKRVRTYNRNHKTLKNKDIQAESLYQEIGRFKYFDNMDNARKYIRSHYTIKDINYAVRDLNRKGFKTMNGKDFKYQNIRWYLQDDLEYEYNKLMRLERSSNKVTK